MDLLQILVPVPFPVQELPNPLPVTFPQPPPPQFWDVPLWQSLVSGLFVFIIGIPVGLWVNRLVLARSQQERKRQLLRAIGKSLKTNHELVKMLVAEENVHPNVTMDLAVLDGTAAVKYELFDDFELAEEIDTVRYWLGDLNRVLSVWNSSAMQFVSGPGSSVPKDVLWEYHSSAVRTRAVKLEKMMEQVLDRIRPKM